MASAELDEHNAWYDDMINTRLWNARLRAANGDVGKAVSTTARANYQELIATHNLDGDGLTRPRRRVLTGVTNPLSVVNAR